MIKVTFRRGEKIYWAVCEKVHESEDPSGYVLDGVIEDSKGMGPFLWAQTTVGWQIVTVEEV